MLVGWIRFLKIDVGLNYVCKTMRSDEHNFLKPTVPIKEMLLYKFLLSIEGNDVASDLKWKLSSNSLVIIPKQNM
jgi:hypothetical protein